MKLSDYVFQYLKDIGVEHVFLLPGGGCMHLVDSLGRSGIPYTVCLHEQAAVIAADGYAQYTGKLGVALVTTGPGATNAITGVAGAWIDSVPLLVISGQCKRADMIGTTGVRQRGPQEVDIVPMVRGITKWVSTIIEPTDIQSALKRAISQATSGRRGPVWLDIPLDVQAAEICEGANPVDRCGSPRARRVAPAPAHQDEMDKAVEWLKSASRPVILAGAGINHIDGTEPILEALSRLGIPVLTTWRAADLLPENHPLFHGRPGMIAQKSANLIQQKSDLMISIGARLDLLQVGFNPAGFAPEAKKIIVDIDQAELDKYDWPIDNINICTDAAGFLLDLSERSCERACPEWIAECDALKKQYPVFPEKYEHDATGVNPYQFIEVLSDASGCDDVIVPGSSGMAAEIMPQCWPIKQGQRYINSPGLGSMGYGLPQAIGVAIASHRRVICVVGDGCLQHNIQELQTMARLGLPIKLFVLNNDGYASIRNSQSAHFGRLVGCDKSSGLGILPSVVSIPNAYDPALADVYGIDSGLVKNSKNMREIINAILFDPRPAICEVIIDQTIGIKHRVTAHVMPDGAMRSGRMDDI